MSLLTLSSPLMTDGEQPSIVPPSVGSGSRTHYTQIPPHTCPPYRQLRKDIAAEFRTGTPWTRARLWARTRRLAPQSCRTLLWNQEEQLRGTNGARDNAHEPLRGPGRGRRTRRRGGHV